MWGTAPTSQAAAAAEDQDISPTMSRPEPTMLLAVSLLSSIAQSRAGQWMRAAVMLQRRARY